VGDYAIWGSPLPAVSSLHGPSLVCVVQVEHRARASESAVQAVVAEVEAAEAAGAIEPWNEGDRPDSLVRVPPTPGYAPTMSTYDMPTKVIQLAVRLPGSLTGNEEHIGLKSRA
jgi:hypothetical protein